MRIMIDLRTGEPAINLDGSLEEITIDRSFYQMIDCLFHTPIMTEPLNPTWGIDHRGIIQASSNPNWEAIIKYMVVEALSPRKEPVITNVNSVDVERDSDGNTITIKAEVQSKYGSISSNMVVINE